MYLKAAGSYGVAEDTERDFLTCDENGFAQTKDMPYGIYTVHQVSGWEGSEKMPDFDVFIAQNGTTYRYYYAGGKLMRMTWGGNTIDFFYDANGAPTTSPTSRVT